ncbi:nucleoside triphosphate pyrophosphohydrolase [Verrucomicrobiota bacterium]
MRSEEPQPGREGRPRGIDNLLAVVNRLRGEGGCPWDREQTLDSLRPYLIEEAYELVDALDSGDPEKHLEELGDLLLQIVLHARIREEEGRFAFEDVAEKLAEKLVRRHPHVFGDEHAPDSGTVLKNWERIKAEEKGAEEGPRSVLEGVPRHLPALQRAQRVQSRAARVGFDWPDYTGPMEKVAEELAETREAIAQGTPSRVRDEIGDLLFAVVNVCRFQRVDAEDALRNTVTRFSRRFTEVERRIWAEGRPVSECSMEELDAVWEDVKAEEMSRPG